MELDDETRRELSGVGDDYDTSALGAAVTDALKRRDLQPRSPRKPGANKPRTTMLPIASVRGDPAHIERLVRWHYDLSLRARAGDEDPRIARILSKIEAKLEARQGPTYDQAPIRDISRANKSDYTLAQLQLAARSLCELLAAIAQGRPPGRDEQDAIAVGLRAFGLTPRDGWVVVVVQEIERERRQMLRRRILQSQSVELENRARAVLARAREQVAEALPQRVDARLIIELLATYSFHSKGGRQKTALARTAAIELLISRGAQV